MSCFSKLRTLLHNSVAGQRDRKNYDDADDNGDGAEAVRNNTFLVLSKAFNQLKNLDVSEINPSLATEFGVKVIHFILDKCEAQDGDGDSGTQHVSSFFTPGRSVRHLGKPLFGWRKSY
jgi:hypothetical protein